MRPDLSDRPGEAQDHQHEAPLRESVQEVLHAVGRDEAAEGDGRLAQLDVVHQVEGLHLEAIDTAREARDDQLGGWRAREMEGRTWSLLMSLSS